ncbi:tyrosine-type recombinase/integrase [Gemmata sp.]|uniref:tyrosine-type recombinase/integrase n=1 Tax=Gemmata sp. TaxID=1914242 RepID=UPI003F72EC97
MVEMDGHQVKLVEGPKDEKHRLSAEEKFAELRRLRRTAPSAPTARTADVVEAFLAWSRQRLSAETHRVNRYYCQLFAEHCGTVLAREIKPHHVTRWIGEMMSPERVEREKERRKKEIETGAVEKRLQGGPPRLWGESTAHNGRVAAYRVFSWAKDEGILPENPLAGMKRPKPAPRQRAMSDVEFQKLYENAGGPFADYLLALRETGARPKELRDLTWDQVQEDRWVLTKHKTVRKVGKARVIILSSAMRAMMDRLKRDGQGHVFLNTEGGPWSMNAVRLQMKRLRDRLGLPSDLCAYLARHGFGTRAILNGVNPVVVAELMGHNSLDMISKVYVHLADEHAHLKAAVEKINSTTKPVQADPLASPRLRAKPVDPKKPGPKTKAAQ